MIAVPREACRQIIRKLLSDLTSFWMEDTQRLKQGKTGSQSVLFKRSWVRINRQIYHIKYQKICQLSVTPDKMSRVTLLD